MLIAMSFGESVWKERVIAERREFFLCGSCEALKMEGCHSIPRT